MGLHWSNTATNYFHNTLDYRILLYILPGPMHPAIEVFLPIQPLTQSTALQVSQGEFVENESPLSVVHCRPSVYTIGNIKCYNPNIYLNQ